MDGRFEMYRYGDRSGQSAVYSTTSFVWFKNGAKLLRGCIAFDQLCGILGVFQYTNMAIVFPSTNSGSGGYVVFISDE